MVKANSKQNAVSIEQIKNRTAKMDDFFEKLKVILDQDSYGVMKLKNKKLIEEKIQKSQEIVTQLLNIKEKSERIIAQYVARTKQIMLENQKLKLDIISKLEVKK